MGVKHILYLQILAYVFIQKIMINIGMLISGSMPRIFPVCAQWPPARAANTAPQWPHPPQGPPPFRMCMQGHACPRGAARPAHFAFVLPVNTAYAPHLWHFSHSARLFCRTARAKRPRPGCAPPPRPCAYRHIS